MFKTVYNFFDKLEDKVRGWFSHFPILYAIVGGVGVVLFWRGVWHTIDFVMMRAVAWRLGESSIDLSSSVWWDGPLSLAAGTAMLLATGVFVSNFIGNEIILSGLRGEKKLTERTEREVRTEAGAIAEIQDELKKITRKLESLEQRLPEKQLERKF